MLVYWKTNGLKAAEFYLADGAPTVYSTSEYAVYTSEKYGYIFFN